MKKLVIYIYSIVLISSCTKKFDSINTNPTVLSSVDKSSAGPLFASSQFNGLILQPSNYQTSENLFGDLYAQYFANTSQSFQSDRNIQVAAWVNGFWTSFYTQAVPQIQLASNLTKDDLAAYSITKVWSVFMFHRMTDYFGPIPYSQAGNGSTNVAYDSQQSIYTSFFTTLDDAIANLQKYQGQNRFSTNDQIFGGNVTQWFKFANTLKLRLALRISKVDPALAKTKAEEAVASGVITDNADNAVFKTTLNSQNPYPTITLASWGGPRMSATAASFLKGYNDPRLPFYFSAINGKYLSLRNGLSATQLGAASNAISALSNMAPSYLGTNYTQPFTVITAAEAYFLRAEGALNGWNMNGTAATLYSQGITSSMTQYGIQSTAVTAYINDNTSTPVAPSDYLNSPAVATVGISFSSDPTIQREQIATQKWIALYPNGWEAWAEMRRTGYPLRYPNANTDDPAVPTNSIVRRLTFPAIETQTNSSEVKKATNLLGGNDAPLTRLWWDK